MAVVNNLGSCLKISYVIFAFCSAFFLGALKGLIVGPIAGLTLIAGNVGVILGLFPAHVTWTVYTVAKTNRFDIPLKLAILVALPALFGIWLGLSIAISVLVGVGYGFFTPWISAFEAFRQDTESNKFFHCLVDGTWGTIKGSCTVVTDFADLCYHSYPLYLKELRESPASDELQTLRLIHVPGCIIVGIIGLVIDIPLFTAIAVVKSPYLLFKGWFRLAQDAINREGPFLEIACIPVAGLTILLWPIIVIGFVLTTIFASIFVGLYGAVVVFQERSFRRGVSYVIAVVGEFDEYTNDWLYLREGTIFPKPRYRMTNGSFSSEVSVVVHPSAVSRVNSSGSVEPPAMLVPSLVRSVSVRGAIQEVRMVQIWEHMMGWFEMEGKELLDQGVITPDDLYESLKGRHGNESSIINVGLPSYALLHTLLRSIKAGAHGVLLLDGSEVTHLNRPQDKFLDWFFNPIMVLKDQIRVIKLGESEVRYLEKVVLFGNHEQRMEAWDNSGNLPQENLRAAQILGISRRMMGMVRSVSKLPTYRRRFRQVVKALITYWLEKQGLNRTGSMSSGDFIEEPGVTTDEIDEAVHSMIIENGAYPSPLGYGGFPKSVCTSDGDIINIDVTVYLNGYNGDTSCNSPIPRRPTGVIEGALWTRVYSFRHSYVSRYWSRETSA
uniref:Peptidase M24 domain-containing protein n=1 Tax=Brassica campestris TaxID=3711 RepID=M4D286_BRACM